MANRRMFAKTITKSGRFLRMPASSRLLYYDLGMEADDDGVVEAFKVSQEGIVRNYSFDDERLRFRWVDKAEIKCEVLYNDMIILRKQLRKIIITRPENEEKCMLLVMAFLAAESPHGKDVISKVSPGL